MRVGGDSKVQDWLQRGLRGRIVHIISDVKSEKGEGYKVVEGRRLSYGVGGEKI